MRNEGIMGNIRHFIWTGTCFNTAVQNRPKTQAELVLTEQWALLRGLFGKKRMDRFFSKNGL